MEELPRRNSSTEQLPTSLGERPRKRILVVEDDKPLASFLAEELSPEFVVHHVQDGEAGLKLAQGEERYDLVILDVNLPTLDGIDVLRQVKNSQPRLPILMLTGRSRVEDKVKALKCGADDYLVKPFSWLECQARVEALLRRNRDVTTASSRVGDLVLHRDERRVERNGRRIDLTPREFSILEFMMRTPGRPITRAALLQEVWNMPPDPSTNIVDVYMKYVRDKVDGPGEVKLTHTIRGVGYELREA